jgi:hypothetical protein
LAYETQYNGYVKFVRGTPAAWASITTKDPDTLYFIAEVGATKGVLYLGERIITGEDQTFSIRDLTDVLISENVSTNSLLIYNGERWVNQSALEIISTYIDEMDGATEEQDGSTGLVPAPKAGEHNFFLKGDGTWVNPTAELQQTVQGLDTKVKSLDTTIGNLVGTDSNKTIRAIAAEEMQKVVGGASEAFDTLLEVEQWIEQNKEVADLADLMTDVDQLNDAVFGIEATEEAEAVPGLVEVVSGLDDLIHGTPEQEGILTKLSAVDATFINVNREITNTNNRVTTLENRLKWGDLVETTEE